MAHIWIFGDSWGDEWGAWGTAFGVPPDKGFVYHLEQAGHTVINLAKAGAGNRQSLHIAKRAEEAGAVFPSHVIQFWTDVTRDWNPSSKWNFESIVYKENETQLKLVKEIQECLKNPNWAIIGGHAPVPDFVEDYINVSFLKNNWRAELLGKEFDFVSESVIGRSDLVENKFNRDSIRYKTMLVDNIEKIQSLLKQSKYFYDNAHPIWKAYQNLLLELKPWITSTEKNSP